MAYAIFEMDKRHLRRAMSFAFYAREILMVMCRPDNNSSSAVVAFYKPGPSVQGVDASIHWTIFELPLTF
jgi:hypothetical protein